MVSTVSKLFWKPHPRSPKLKINRERHQGRELNKGLWQESHPPDFNIHRTESRLPWECFKSIFVTTPFVGSYVRVIFIHLLNTVYCVEGTMKVRGKDPFLLKTCIVMLPKQKSKYVHFSTA